MIGIFPPTYTFIEEQALKDELKINLWSSVADSLNSSSSTISLKIKSSTVSTMTESEEMNISERLKHWAVAFLDPFSQWERPFTVPSLPLRLQCLGKQWQSVPSTRWLELPWFGKKTRKWDRTIPFADPPVTETRRHVHPHHCVYTYIYISTNNWNCTAT